MSETYIVIVFVPIPTPLTAWRGRPQRSVARFGATLATRAWIGNTESSFPLVYLPPATRQSRSPERPTPSGPAAPSRDEALAGEKAVPARPAGWCETARP